MLEPITRSVTVECNQETAFNVFIKELGSWWPHAPFTVSAMKEIGVRSITVDAQVGGKIIETGEDGESFTWGTIIDYNPFDSLKMDFHIPAPGTPNNLFTFIEMTFTPLTDSSTQVDLLQTNFGALGDMAEPSHQGYGFAWTPIFEQAYANACANA